MPDYRLGRLKGEFVVVWEEGGKRRRYRLGTRTPQEARSILREFIRHREQSLDSGYQRPTIEAIWNDYIAEKRAEGKVSVARMADAWKRLHPAWGDCRPDDVGGSRVRDYTRQRRAQGASDGTIHVELGYLRAALRYSLRERAPHITLPSKPRPRTRHLTPDEARRLLDGAEAPHVKLYIRLALHTAGRPSSILGLVWNRVDEARQRIILDDPHRDRTAKGRATVPLAESVLCYLQEARSSALTEYVIEWAGRPVGSIKKAIARAAERAGLNGVTPYMLRHTAAVWMAEAGVPMAEIAQYLGHNNPGTTYRVYARFSPEYLRSASEAITARLKDTGDRGCAEPTTVNTKRTKQVRKGTKKRGKR